MRHHHSPLVGIPAAALVVAMALGAPASASTTSSSPTQAAPDQAVGSTVRISLRYDGSQTTELNGAPSFSDNGRYVAYTTEDKHFTGPDGNPCCQAVRYDRKTKTTEVISLTRQDQPAHGGGAQPVLSADGNIAAFWSGAKHLVHNDTNDAPDVFLRNFSGGKMVLASRTPDGAPGNGDSRIPSISADGKVVAFQSDASNLAAGDTNQITDIFLYDTQTLKVTLISRGLDGKSAKGQSLLPEISADGKHVVYESSANNIVESDGNVDEDIFSYDIASGATSLISTTEDGQPANGGSHNPSVSGDGLFVTFWSFASNLAPNDDNGEGDVFVRTTDSPKITLVSHTSAGHSGAGESDDPTISTDGRTIAFQSFADLDPADDNESVDIYRYDLSSGAVVLVSTTPTGAASNGPSFLPSLSGDGGYVTFESIATDLVKKDTNGKSDVFVTRLE